MLFGAGDAGVFAGAAPAEHRLALGAFHYKGYSVIVNLTPEPFPFI